MGVYADLKVFESFGELRSKVLENCEEEEEEWWRNVSIYRSSFWRMDPKKRQRVDRRLVFLPQHSKAGREKPETTSSSASLLLAPPTPTPKRRGFSFSASASASAPLSFQFSFSHKGVFVIQPTSPHSLSFGPKKAQNPMPQPCPLF